MGQLFSLDIVLELLKLVEGEEISDFKILKRDTVDKSDYIYCMIKYIVENEELTQYYILTYYHLPTGNWHLTDYFPYNIELWSTQPEAISFIEETH